MNVNPGTVTEDPPAKDLGNACTPDRMSPRARYSGL